MQNYYSKFKLPCPQNPKSPCQKLRKSPPSMIPTTPRYPGGDFLAGRFGILWVWKFEF